MNLFASSLLRIAGATCGIAMLARCSGNSQGPVASFVAPTAVPSVVAIPGATSTPSNANASGSSASFVVTVPLSASASAKARAAAVRGPAYVSTGTTSITVAVVTVNGVAPSPAISSTVTVSSCPIASGGYVCTLTVPTPPGTDVFRISAFGPGNVLISQQGTTKTIAVGPNDFSGSPITLDANPQTATVTLVPANPGTSIGTVSATSTTLPSIFVLHGSETQTFTVTFKDAVGNTITSGIPAFSASTGDPAIAVSTSGTTLTVAPTGKNESFTGAAHGVSVTLAPANPSTDGLSSATTALSVVVNSQIAAVPNVNTTGSIAQVNLYVYGCPTSSTCALTPVNQLMPGDGKGIITESSTTAPFAAAFDGSGDLGVCTALNGSGPIQLFPYSAITSVTVGSATATFTNGISGIKACDVAPSTDFVTVAENTKSTTTLFAEFAPAISTSTPDFTYGTASQGASADVPASVNVLTPAGATAGSTVQPIALALEAPSNLACTPSGTAPCGEIALVTKNGGSQFVNYLPAVYNNSGAFLTAWDGKNSRLIVACGTADAGGKFDLLSFAITPGGASGATGTGPTTIALLPARPVRLAVSASGAVAVAYATSASTNEIDTYSAANARIGTIAGLSVGVRGLAFYDDATLFVTTSTSTSSGTLGAYGINSATAQTSITFSSSSPTTVAVSTNV